MKNTVGNSDHESQRIAALHALDVLDSEPEPEFDSLVEIASRLCAKPIACISLLDSDRQWFKASVGLGGLTQTDRNIAFCDHTVRSGNFLEVCDTLKSPEFADNPLVTAAPNIRYYAGAPLQLSSGEYVGTLCVLDRKAGQLDPAQNALLRNLAKITVHSLETRKASRELKARQAELQILQERERSYYESTPAMLFAVDPKGRIQSISNLLLAKLAAERNAVIGEYLTDFMSPASKLHALETGFPELLKTGRVQSVPYQLLSRRGELFDVLISGTLQRDATGAPVCGLCSVEDVTERLRIEQALADERKHLRNIVNGTSAGTWELDFVTGQDLINETYSQMLGYTVEEMEARISGNFMNVVHPDDRDHVGVQWRAHLSGMTTEYETEFRVQHREGHWVWILSRGKVGARDAQGNPLHISGIHLDISARRNAIDMATRAAHDLQNTLDALPSRVVYWDKDLNYRFGNKAFRNRFSPNGRDLTGKSMLEVLGPVLNAQNLNVMREMTDGKERQTERRVDFPDGKIEHSIVRFLPDLMDGEVQGYYVFVFDITEIKAAQAQLEALNEELARRSAQAEAASVSKSAFLASMSHEIRTPMNAILGMHSLIQKTSLTPRQLDYLKKSERAAKSLLGLLNDILDYSKVEAGKLSLDPQPFRMDDLLDEMSVIFSAYVGNKPVEVLFDVGSGLPEVLVGDSLRIKQVLINLGGNAIKFTEQGSVVIRIVWDGNRNGISKTHFYVIDSGIGIAPEHQSHIFDGFSQAEASTTRKFGGTGLGLAISKRLVEMMGGRIALESAPGKGSSFSFELTLPALSEVPPSLQKSRAGAHPIQRVLVIDDHPLSGELLRIAGRSLSWAVEVVSSGAQGIQRVKQGLSDPDKAYDLLLIDWQMPEMDGWETARHLREVTRGAAHRPLMLMVSANSMEMVSHRTDEEQAMLDGFLSKPVTPAMLSSAVEAAVSTDPQVSASDQGASLRRLAGMNILVVEDNLINQQVAEELLLSEGARVSLAANGLQGVEAIKAANPPYDAVLMDIQMPVMDGHTAVRAIRQELGLATLPVIGLTANALLSDRSDCLASGMNEHVGKPFEMEHLVAVLLRLTGMRPREAGAASLRAPMDASVASGTTGATGAPRVLGMEMVNADIDLPSALRRMSGMEAMYLRAARDFYHMLSGLLPQFDLLVRTGDLVGAKNHLHTFKGTAGTVGLTRLAKELARIEALCQSGGDIADICTQSVSLGTTVKMAKAALEAAASHLGKPFDLTPVVTTPHAAVPAAKMDDDMCLALQEIARLADAGDLEVLEYFAHARALLSNAGEAFLAELEEAMQALDLAEVASICKRSGQPA